MQRRLHRIGDTPSLPLTDHKTVNHQLDGVLLIFLAGDLLTQISNAQDHLNALLAEVDAMEDMQSMALTYQEKVVPAMAALRKPVDEMELLVDKSIWPVPTYGDLMFEV